MSSSIKFNITDLRVGDIVWNEELDKFAVIDDETLGRIMGKELRIEPIYLDDKVLHQVLGGSGCVEVDPYRWRIYLDDGDNEYTFWDWKIVLSWKGNVRCHEVVIKQCYYLHELQHSFKDLRLRTDISNSLDNFLVWQQSREYYKKR